MLNAAPAKAGAHPSRARHADADRWVPACEAVIQLAFIAPSLQITPSRRGPGPIVQPAWSCPMGHGRRSDQTQVLVEAWVPACAGMARKVNSRIVTMFVEANWVTASFAGTTRRAARLIGWTILFIFAIASPVHRSRSRRSVAPRGCRRRRSGFDYFSRPCELPDRKPGRCSDRHRLQRCDTGAGHARHRHNEQCPSDGLQRCGRAGGEIHPARMGSWRPRCEPST
jgi:hypothetical protein